MSMNDRRCLQKLEPITVLLLDVDGVLTDGKLIYNDRNIETKHFHVKDGLGIKLLNNFGIRVGIVTSRRSKALRHRCENLNINTIFDNVTDKSLVLNDICNLFSVSKTEVAFVGDDIQDLPLLNRVGCAIAVADAHNIVKEHADIVTRLPGGAGAVREVCELILEAKGLLKQAMCIYLK